MCGDTGQTVRAECGLEKVVLGQRGGQRADPKVRARPLGSGVFGGARGLLCPPLDANVDVATMERVEEALEQCGPLQGEGGH